jgi:hypothetical protein
VNIRVGPFWCLWLDIGEYTCSTLLVFVVGHTVLLGLIFLNKIFVTFQVSDAVG